MKHQPMDIIIYLLVRADSNSTPKQLTHDKRNNRSIILNKKRTQAVYLSGRDEVRLLGSENIAKQNDRKDEIWAFQSSDPGFSPNDDYVLFTAKKNFEGRHFCL
jgi:hypothetical protein